MNVQDLQVVQFLRESTKNGLVPTLVTRLQGTVQLEDYSVSVIGEPTNSTRTLKVTFNTTQCSSAPPQSGSELGTAHLGFTRADWEIGLSNQWWLECYLPEPAINSLEAGVTAGTLNSVSVGLRLTKLYCDSSPFAPISEKRHLYLRPDRKSNTLRFPETASGYVVALVMAFSKVDMRPVAPQEDDTHREHMKAREDPPDAVAVAVSALSENLESLRSTMKWVGSIVAVALLVLALR